MSQPMSLLPELLETGTSPVLFRFGTAKKARRGIVEVMPKPELMPMKVLVMGLCLSLSSWMAPQALAFDPQSGVSKESGPFDLFKFGFSSYKEGRKRDAVEAYRYAAEKGHTASRWKLANMYADGDGVQEDDLEAFKIYSEIAQAGVEPESQDTSYFANALIALASYYRRGIPNSPVKIDLTQARQLYFQAASAFGIPEAQFQLGRMMLKGEGGSVSVHQAKKWLNRARNNGHAGAMGLFGNILFQEGDFARGLAFMTAALDHCLPKDCAWLQATQEEAFSVASEEDRRQGVALAQNIRFNPGE